jgi:hypothetical protein
MRQGGGAVPSTDLTELLDIAATSRARSLNQLGMMAVQSVAGCSAANVVLWDDREPVLLTSTHPDLAHLVPVQTESGRGPVLTALAQAEPVSCPDTLTEQRWPEFAAAALGAGVRCSMHLAYLAGSSAVTLAVFGSRPRVLDPRHAQPAELLAALGGAVLGAVTQYDDARRTASQLRDAADSRAVVDQAKGILMHALGCSADEALERMRQASQLRNVRATDVARQIVESGGRGNGFWRAAARPQRARTGF